MKFSNYNLKSYIYDGLRSIEFYETTEIQSIVIPKIINKENVICKSNTGTGKTHAFIIPMLQNLNEDDKNCQVTIISPTRELCEQIYKEINKIIKFNANIDCRMYIGGTDREQEIKRLEKSQPQIVIGTIGKINDLAVNNNYLKIHTSNLVVIDEADMVFEDAELEEVDKVFSKLNEDIEIALFSATMSNEVIKFINHYLKKCEVINITNKKELIKSEINHAFIPTKNQDKNELLLSILKTFDPYLCLIFANTKDKVNEVASFLADNGVISTKLTGDLQPRERKQVLKRIKDGAFKYVVCSDIASRGLDITGVSHVINYELPKDIDFFIHRVGRTARYHLDGVAISFYDYEDDEYINNLRRKGLTCTYMALKDGVLKETSKRNRPLKSKKVLKIEEELHLKTPMPKKVKPGYKKKRNEEIKKKLRKMKRKRIDSMYHKKGHKINED